ncbi:hypothetical protein ACG04Q_12070 [Roseateles sp. DXS20W]|uniref:Uncharacterized protein n=1 Tax=Pelomonas lactea TaxID=3299030 RepID=A0ABW7GK45_9BURK
MRKLRRLDEGTYISTRRFFQFAMHSKLFLYSAAPYAKYLIQANYLNDVHYVWCSEAWDFRAMRAGTLGSHVAVTSNPRDICSNLRRHVGDGHNPYAMNVRNRYAALTAGWVKEGKLSQDQSDEIAAILSSDNEDLWQPVLYVIRRDAVKERMEVVRRESRAGIGLEYIIRDLVPTEFDLLRLHDAG